MKVIQTKNFHIEIDEVVGFGWFEHNRLGDECGGGLWFEPVVLLDRVVNYFKNRKATLMLTDYDGVYELPSEVEQALLDNGYQLEI